MIQGTPYRNIITIPLYPEATIYMTGNKSPKGCLTMVWARFIRLSINDVVLPWGNLFDNQLDNFHPTTQITDLKQIMMGWLINTRHECTSHGNHIYGHTIFLQYLCFKNGQMAIKTGMAISNKKNCFSSKMMDTF